MSRCLLLVLLTGCGVQAGFGQLSGYFSASYGYHSNPLTNYERGSDRLVQNYLELGYEHDFGNAGVRAVYTGGLTMFSTLSDRTYYEHTLDILYARRYEQDDRGTSEEAEDPDSTGRYLALGLRGTARHDRALYRDYDNSSAEVRTSYRFMLGSRSFLRLSGNARSRSYARIQELSNVAAAAWVDLGFPVGASGRAELFASAGWKGYTTAMYDTVRFEEITPSVSAGKGKKKGTGTGTGGGNGAGSSSKLLLSNPRSNGTSQLSIGARFLGAWESISLLASVEYRFNPPGSQPRYLAQYASTSTLTEDIYSDHFNFSGPEVNLTYNQPLGADLRLSMHAAGGARAYEGPALTLLGEQTAEYRRDGQLNAELTLTRPVPLGRGVSLEISLLTGYTRNQSNDEYNDYSAFSIALALGLGF